MKKTLGVVIMMCMMAFAVSFGLNSTVHATGEGNPRLIIEEYSISEDEIVPGEIFTLNMKIRNTSQFFDVFTVVFSLTDTDGEMVYPVYGEADQIYVDRIYARSTTEVNIRLKAAQKITSDIVPVEFTITFNDDHYVEKQYNNTTLYLPVRTTGDLDVVSCTVPEHAGVGTKARVSASYRNTGSGKLSNVMMKVTAADQVQNVSLYNLDGGSKNVAEAYLDCNALGEMPVKVSFTYENDKGEVFETKDYAYRIDVVENDYADAAVQSDSLKGFRVLSVISAIAVIIVAAEIIMALRRKK